MEECTCAKCFWECWFCKKYKFYPYETQKGIKFFADDVRVIMENNDEYSQADAYEVFLNDVIMFDHLEDCQENGRRPI